MLLPGRYNTAVLLLNLFRKETCTFRHNYIEADYCFSGQNFVVVVSVFESDLEVSEFFYFVVIHQFSVIKKVLCTTNLFMNY